MRNNRVESSNLSTLIKNAPKRFWYTRKMDTEDIPAAKPENKEVLADNARKFVARGISQDLLKESRSCLLTVDWLETNENDEKKIIFKEFVDGEKQLLLVTKVSKDGNRVSERRKIDQVEYDAFLKQTLLCVAKRRYEFKVTQNEIVYAIRYDEFQNSELRVLEVDASNDLDRTKFDPTLFPAELTEVTGNIGYYGYRVADLIKLK
jgi:hypothetical protein